MSTDRVLLRGDLPGLLRHGCPVVYVNQALPHITGRGVVCDPAPGDEDDLDALVPWMATLCGYDPIQEALDGLAPGCGATGGFGYRVDVRNVLSLDLGDEAGRDRAARWLAGVVGLRVEATAPGWYAVGRATWVLQCGPWTLHFAVDATDKLTRAVASLADIAPDDPNRDALALARCCEWAAPPEKT